MFCIEVSQLRTADGPRGTVMGVQEVLSSCIRRCVKVHINNFLLGRAAVAVELRITVASFSTENNGRVSLNCFNPIVNNSVPTAVVLTYMSSYHDRKTKLEMLKEIQNSCKTNNLNLQRRQIPKIHVQHEGCSAPPFG